jgi:flavin-dependent dehydrogenase
MMSRILIVGSGLSGLTAGICLARDGYEAEIWERGSAIGGVALDQGGKTNTPFAIADMTPFDVGRLSRYLGFDLTPDEKECKGVNYFTSLSSARFYIAGTKCEMVFPEDLQMKLVERGPRPSALDTHLYRTACNAGVKFRFDTAVETRKDFSELPPGTILATGMFKKTFLALDVPFTPAYAYFAVREFENHRGPETVVYLDKFTKDYGYFTIINGVGAAVLFRRGAGISVAAREWFRRRLKEDEGLDFENWRIIEDYVGMPTRSLSNPRLFHDRFILTGTLAGFQDPSWVIGVHGALVSGKIAALAVKDRAKALQEFRRMNRWWRLCYLAKRFFDAVHPLSTRLIYKPVIRSRARFHQRYLWFLYPAIPGLRRI